MAKAVEQKNVFLSGEGDCYHERNRGSESNPATHFLSEYVKVGDRILEIGCGDGRNKDFLTLGKASRYVGLDPSSTAIMEAQKKYKDGEFIVGTSDDLPFENNSFDFIYFGFCLYLTDRHLLTRVVYEVDRCLKGKGILAITDFSPKNSHEVSYHHKAGIKTFKFDYPSLFTAFPHYHSIEKRPHFSRDSIPRENEWVTTNILLKDSNL